MKSHRIGVRVSAELHALLAAAGDVSAATRALAILGAASAGYELGALRDEAGGLLAAPLDAPLRAALRRLLGERSTPVPQTLDNRSTRVEPMLNNRSTPVPQLLNVPEATPLADVTPDRPLAPVPLSLSDDDPLTSEGIEV